MSGEVRVLVAGDEALLFSFLEKRLESSVLLVSEVTNTAAIRAYTALGYEPLGEFGLLLFR